MFIIFHLVSEFRICNRLCKTYILFATRYIFCIILYLHQFSRAEYKLLSLFGMLIGIFNCLLLNLFLEYLRTRIFSCLHTFNNLDRSFASFVCQSSLHFERQQFDLVYIIFFIYFDKSVCHHVLTI